MEKELRSIKWIIVMVVIGFLALYIIKGLRENEEEKIRYYQQQQERLSR
ncbi:MAG: hypothetical protein K8I03_14510 [Ignavibacteria bacterium]|nr:hypothetical protein [Ignavibacteria bacterium]